MSGTGFTAGPPDGSREWRRDQARRSVLSLEECRRDSRWWESRAKELGPVSYTHLDVYKRQGELLGYKPVVDFRTGLQRTVEWYRLGGEGIGSRA